MTLSGPRWSRCCAHTCSYDHRWLSRQCGGLCSAMVLDPQPPWAASFHGFTVWATASLKSGLSTVKSDGQWSHIGISKARISCGFSTMKQKAPLTLAPLGFQGTSWHYLCTEGSLTLMLTADKAERTSEGLANRPVKSPTSQKFSFSKNSWQVTAPKTYSELARFSGKVSSRVPLCLSGHAGGVHFHSDFIK